MGKRGLVAGVVVLGLVAGFGWWLGNRWASERPLRPFSPECTVEASEGRVRLEGTQMANAATITAVGVRMEMPDRAVVVALATAFQESKLRNLPDLGRRNDHDSIGLFQQRPSQGWGEEEQLLDPRFASEQFYRALAEVPGWQEMRVTEAAQLVQRSAFPEAYQRWEPDARVLATSLLGQVGAAVACTQERDPQASDPATLGAALGMDWGEQVEVTPADPPGVTVRASDAQVGWAYAHWLVAHAAFHGVSRVSFADQEWTAASGGWSTTDTDRDHVLAAL